MEVNDNQWKGYTLEELRVMRVVNLAKIELTEARLKHITEKYSNPKAMVTSSPIMNKLLGALDFFDYGVLAYRIGKRALSLLRRRRRK